MCAQAMSQKSENERPETRRPEGISEALISARTSGCSPYAARA